jgi:hypothetical protein
LKAAVKRHAEGKDARVVIDADPEAQLREDGDLIGDAVLGPKTGREQGLRVEPFARPRVQGHAGHAEADPALEIEPALLRVGGGFLRQGGRRETGDQQQSAKNGFHDLLPIPYQPEMCSAEIVPPARATLRHFLEIALRGAGNLPYHPLNISS